MALTGNPYLDEKILHIVSELNYKNVMKELIERQSGCLLNLPYDFNFSFTCSFNSFDILDPLVFIREIIKDMNGEFHKSIERKRYKIDMNSHNGKSVIILSPIPTNREQEFKKDIRNNNNKLTILAKHKKQQHMDIKYMQKKKYFRY